LLVLALPQIVLADEVPATVRSLKGDVTVTDSTGKPVSITQGSKLPQAIPLKPEPTVCLGLTLVPGAGTVGNAQLGSENFLLNFNKGADGSNNRNIHLNLRRQP